VQPPQELQPQVGLQRELHLAVEEHSLVQGRALVAAALALVARLITALIGRMSLPDIAPASGALRKSAPHGAVGRAARQDAAAGANSLQVNR